LNNCFSHSTTKVFLVLFVLLSDNDVMAQCLSVCLSGVNLFLLNTGRNIYYCSDQSTGPERGQSKGNLVIL